MTSANDYWTRTIKIISQTADGLKFSSLISIQADVNSDQRSPVIWGHLSKVSEQGSH